jgi:predicted anti-sigma-YlaC factor YlaD
MRCKRAEHWILRSMDHPLSDEQQQELAEHLHSCPACRAMEQEYHSLRQTLQHEDFPAPQPYFWERLQPRLQENRRPALMPLWKEWGLRAIPMSLAVILMLVLAGIFLFNPQAEQLSDSGILLRNQNPFPDTLLLADEEVENPNMVLIFSSLDDSRLRRYFP